MCTLHIFLLFFITTHLNSTVIHAGVMKHAKDSLVSLEDIDNLLTTLIFLDTFTIGSVINFIGNSNYDNLFLLI